MKINPIFHAIKSTCTRDWFRSVMVGKRMYQHSHTAVLRFMIISVFAALQATSVLAQNDESTSLNDHLGNDYNFKSFEVVVSRTGSYYTGFWLLPAKYHDGTYTNFKVYVNSEYVGDILPTCGNWQSAHVDGNEVLYLTRGNNIITVATLAPEVPEIETIKVSYDEASAIISSDEYDEYLNTAIDGTYDSSAIQNYSATLNELSSNGGTYFTNVPLNYTFYKTFSFTQGQEIFITSSSSVKHNIDIVYYGEPIRQIVQPGREFNDSLISRNQEMNTQRTYVPEIIGPLYPNRPGILYKPLQLYTPATSFEMQGLNWLAPSQKSLNSNVQVATARITIPKSGLYLVRLRTDENDIISVADLNINGNYYYQDAPISFNGVDYVIPADGNIYAAMTCCNDFGTDDPFLFIHGGVADKVVGYNDDGPSSKLNQYDLSSWDSYIAQQYFIPTSKISVCNYSSSKPQSTCNIFVGREGDVTSANMLMEARSLNASSLSDDNTTNIQIPSFVNLGNKISFTSENSIRTISVKTISGLHVCCLNRIDTNKSLTTSDLNISNPGIYLIQVETEQGMQCKKVMVK